MSDKTEIHNEYDDCSITYTENVKTNFNIGDHIKVKRYGGVYAHHGVYIGEQKVVHLTGGIKQGVPAVCGGTGSAYIQVDDLDVFENGSKSTVVNKMHPNKNKDDMLEVVQSKLGSEVYYNLILNNCEHFASDISINYPVSKQVRIFSITTGIGSITSLVAAFCMHTIDMITIIPFALSSMTYWAIQKYS